MAEQQVAQAAGEDASQAYGHPSTADESMNPLNILELPVEKRSSTPSHLVLFNVEALILELLRVEKGVFSKSESNFFLRSQGGQTGDSANPQSLVSRAKAGAESIGQKLQSNVENALGVSPASSRKFPTQEGDRGKVETWAKSGI